jgi:WD40 repeat protein
MDGAFSPDGTRIATACADGTAQLWDLRTGKAIGDALVHENAEDRENYVLTLTFSPDGRKLLTGCADGRARLWDVASGALDFQMHHDDQIIAVNFSPDGLKIATCSRDNTARVWRVEDGQPVTPPLTHNGFVMACAFSPDSRLVVTASQDDTAVMWDAETGRPVGEAMRHQASVYCAAFSPDGRSVLTAGYGGEAGLWRRQEVPERTVTFTTFGSAVYHARFIQNGELLLTRSCGPVDWLARRLGGDSAVQVWDVTTSDPVTPALTRLDKSKNPAITHDNRFVLTGGSNGIVRIWQLRPDKRPVEDLTKFATVLSGRRIDPAKGEVLVPPQQLGDLLRELRSKYPASFSSSPLDVSTWQRLLASASVTEQTEDAKEEANVQADDK